MDMKMWTTFLHPFAWIYGEIMVLRNYLFDKGVLKSHLIEQSSIAVGNLSAGGTGKSVAIDYLISHFKANFSLAVISRGYKRSTKGVVIASKRSTAEILGDEPFQFFSKHPEIQVLVAEKRLQALDAIQTLEKKPEVLLFDDLLQHRYLIPKVMILTTTYAQPYFEDSLLPLGQLREAPKGARRAEVILVTKCPNDLNLEQQERIRNNINPLKNQALFFTKIEYSKKILNHKHSKPLTSFSSPFLLITGVANPTPLLEHLQENKIPFSHLEFPDHHVFKPNEIENIKKQQQGRTLLTTEKDFGRLQPYFALGEVYYLPIKMSFLSKEEEEAFLKLLYRKAITV